MSHLRPKLKYNDLVCRKDGPRHVGVVLRMFICEKYGGWTANVCWCDNNIKEYVPMKDLVAPAIANALANATGVGFPHLPFTADRIFSKLQP